MPLLDHKYRHTLLLLAAALLASCRQEAPQSVTAPLVWSQFVEQHVEEYLRTHPTFAAGAGRHEFDGVMPDWSPAGIAKDIAWLHAQRERAMAFTTAQLSARERFERDYVVARIDRDLFWLENSAAPFKNPGFYFGTLDSIDPSLYVTRPYAPLEQRATAFVKYARAIPAVALQIRANLRTPLPVSFSRYGVAGFGGLADFYRNDVVTAFAGITDAKLQQELTTAIEPAARSMQELADWLKTAPQATGQEFALGGKLFTDMLWMTERVNTPLDQLVAHGRADLERNTAALKAACSVYAPRASLAQCMAKMHANKPTGGAVDGARAQLAGLKQFLVDQQLVSIPGTQEAQVANAPPYRAQNSAYIDIPGPYEQQLPAVYYIAPPDKSWSKAEQDAYIPGKAALLFTSVHEVWPGHFLQFLHSNRSSFRFGQLFVGYAFAEGWAHYSEEAVLEYGLGTDDPELRIGQLRQALLRNVRFLSAIGLHTKGMTVAESESMFRELALLDAGNARQQAARGTYDPAYLNYTLGKLMIRKLRKDWTAARNVAPADERKAWREFHDTFLSFGGPPIPIVRNQMLPDQGGSVF